ncbi:MAG TPA: hypothetical protein VF255_07535 [Solirubrobacterales bacterium]
MIGTLTARWHWAIPAGAILCLLAPILLTDNTFASDWGNHYWLVYMQGLDIKALNEPSIYLQSGLGAFYPYYAFYGGTFYAVTGFVSAVFGTELAVLLAYAGAIAANYLGWTWIARQAGIGGWRSQLPGLIAVTAPLAVTNLYGRGGIPEVIGTSMLPLVAAAAISLVREPRMRLRDMAAFVAGLVFLTGSHTLSMVWGLALLALLAVVLIACHWELVKERAMRLLGIAWLATLAGCINAWMLAPMVAYHSRTVENEPDRIGQTDYTQAGDLFRVLRDMPDIDPVLHGDINAALPVLAIVWAFVAGVAFWGWLAPRMRVMGIALTAVLAGLVLLILNPSLLSELPEFLQYIQFPYRLLTYANFCVVGMITLLLAAAERHRASAGAVAAVTALAAIALFSLAISVGQNSEVRSWLGGRDEALASTPNPPPSWYAFLQFADGSAPIVKPTLEAPLTVPVTEEIRDSYRVEYPPGPAGTVQTNIATGSYLVDVSGATRVGRDRDGRMIVRLPASLQQPRVVEVSAEDSATVVVGRWISAISILAALGALAACVLARRRRRA